LCGRGGGQRELCFSGRGEDEKKKRKNVNKVSETSFGGGFVFGKKKEPALLKRIGQPWERDSKRGSRSLPVVGRCTGSLKFTEGKGGKGTGQKGTNTSETRAEKKKI